MFNKKKKKIEKLQKEIIEIRNYYNRIDERDREFFLSIYECIEDNKVIDRNKLRDYLDKKWSFCDRFNCVSLLKGHISGRYIKSK